MSEQQPKKPSDNRTATQKIQDLENAVMSLFHVNDNLAKDLLTLKEAVKLLDNKLNSVVKAVNAGEELTDTVLTRLMIENNVEQLRQRVQAMITQGYLAAETQVTDNAFVVGAEVSDDGTVQNPRIQFALKTLKPALQVKLIGANVGDSISFQEGTLKFKLLETYAIMDPTAPQAPAASPDATAPAAPSEAPTSTDAQGIATAPTAPAADATDSTTPPTATAQPDQTVTPASN